MADPMPPQPSTVQLPAVPAWAIELTRSVREGFAGVDARLDTIEANVELQGGTTRDVAKRMTGLEERVQHIEERQHTTSVRIKEPSEHDLETQRDLAVEIVARKKLATDVEAIKADTAAQTVILTKLETAASKFAANPIVRSIAVMLGTAILTWLAAHGGHTP